VKDVQQTSVPKGLLVHAHLHTFNPGRSECRACAAQDYFADPEALPGCP